MGLQLGEEGWLLSDSPGGAGASLLPFPRSPTCREPRVSVLCFKPSPPALPVLSEPERPLFPICLLPWLCRCCLWKPL